MPRLNSVGVLAVIVRMTCLVSYMKNLHLFASITHGCCRMCLSDISRRYFEERLCVPSPLSNFDKGLYLHPMINGITVL